MPSLTDCIADVERGEQRIAIHWENYKRASSRPDPLVRTSSQQEIEADVYEGVR